MGCSLQVQQETQITSIESERMNLSSSYSSQRLIQPFPLKVRFSQGINLREMKKQSEIVRKPCQILEEDPIFQEEKQIDSSLMNQSVYQSDSSRGILKSQKNKTSSYKKVTFDQSQLQKHYQEGSQKKRVKKSKKLRNSIYVF